MLTVKILARATIVTSGGQLKLSNVTLVLLPGTLLAILSGSAIKTVLIIPKILPLLTAQSIMIFAKPKCSLIGL